MDVLVLTEQTGNDRKTLAAVRSLARAGLEVSVAGDTALCTAFWSRHAAHRRRCPSPISQPDAYAAWLLEAVAAKRPDVLLPMSDYTTFVVSTLAQSLAPLTRFATPPVDSFRTAHDKLALLELASRLGIGTPRTYCPGSRSDLVEIARSIEYPAVFKLRKGAGAIGLGFPASADALLLLYDALGTYADEIYSAERPLVQEFVPGPIHDACALFAHGEPVAVLTQVRSLMHPPDGGVGILNETTDDSRVRSLAVELLRALRWHGPAMVEFKEDTRDGTLKLIEINPRFWGTLDLGIQAGVDFPRLTVELALSGSVVPPDGYRVGERYRWAIPYAFKTLHSRGGWGRAWRLLRPDRHCHTETRLSDPLPELAKLLAALHGGWQRLAGGRSRARTLRERVLSG